MDTVFETGLVSMINLRGRVVFVSNSEVPLRKTQGWHIVVNPKRSYYPEFDLEGKQSKETQEGSVFSDDVVNEELLPYEEV